MNGAMSVYIRTSTGEELALDTLGVGSLIGQYSMIENEISLLGYKAISESGCILIQLNLESLHFLAQTNTKIKELLDEQKAEIVKNGVSPIDFVRFNDKSNSENLNNVKIMRLKRF